MSTPLRGRGGAGGEAQDRRERSQDQEFWDKQAAVRNKHKQLLVIDLCHFPFPSLFRRSGIGNQLQYASPMPAQEHFASEISECGWIFHVETFIFRLWVFAVCREGVDYKIKVHVYLSS